MASASQFDRVTIAGPATLDGSVNVSLLNGYTPNPGDSFQFVTFASRSGTFANIDDTNIHDSVGFDVTHNPTNTVLTAKTVIPVPGRSAAPVIQQFSTQPIASTGTQREGASEAEVIIRRRRHRHHSHAL